jgi:hypothetical protein
MLKCSPVIRSLILLAFLALALPVAGLQVAGLYSHRVAVENESDAERNRAFRVAMEAVILKVTGDPRWLDHPRVRQAVENAQNYVEAISYSSEMLPVAAAEEDQQTGPQPETPTESELADSPADEQPATVPAPQFVEQRYIDLDFADGLINEMLAAADIPVWDDNRPSVLVWMAIQDASGSRHMLTADSDPEMMAFMQDFAERRGVPVIFPLLDFEDRRNLSEDQVWALEEQAIANASARYGADSVLAGRVLFTASGELVGLWQFQFQDQLDVFDGFATSPEDYLLAPLDRITSELAGYFAISPDASPRFDVRLRIDGVADLGDYSALMDYVANLGLVESVRTTGLAGERIELLLGVLGSAQQLNELIALDRDLLPIQSTGNEAPALLHYRWTR